jgi:hypothetical protein
MTTEFLPNLLRIAISNLGVVRSGRSQPSEYPTGLGVVKIAYTAYWLKISFNDNNFYGVRVWDAVGDTQELVIIGRNFLNNRFNLFLEGNQAVFIERWYPSSKTCYNCGHVLKELDLNTREWRCPSCQNVNGRDKNAAKNICAVGASTAKLGDVRQAVPAIAV